MYSSKLNIQQLTSIMMLAKIKKVVVCPGSRNAPLVHNFKEAGFECYEITDERSAGFFALGLIEANSGNPVAVCCTSGSAVLNLAPAVAEAYYKPLPLLVITADRPASWIGQKDGQTMIQPGAFNGFIRKTVSLPEPHDKESEWYCNRLINESLIEQSKTGGPVHINVPITEPLFDFSSDRLPEERIISLSSSDIPSLYTELIRSINEAQKPMMVLGQMHPKELAQCAPYIKTLATAGWAIMAEALSNAHTTEILDGKIITDFDLLLTTTTPPAPDLVITMGGHIVSKRLKHYLRANQPKNHIHISKNAEVEDLFQCMTSLVQATPLTFLKAIDNANIVSQMDKQYCKQWINAQVHAPQPILQKLFNRINNSTGNWHCHVANSSMVRKIQLIGIGRTPIFCNRGINGIEGSISCGVGYWCGSHKNTLILTGDLSFFYDQNALWNNFIKSGTHHSALRIVIVNNGGGKIFYGLPGLSASPYLTQYIAASHTTTAEGIAKECGAKYFVAHSIEEYETILPDFLSEEKDIRIMELFIP